MKKFTKSDNIFLLFFLAAVFAVAACSTTGMQRSEAVQSSLKTVDNDIKGIVVQLEAINSSLAQLTKPELADRKKAFEVFTENVSKIKDMRQTFSKHASEMEQNGKEYFKAWDSEKLSYDNPEIQKQSNERRAELGETYDKIAKNNVGVKEAFKTYVSDVNEIQRFLSNDLTSEGVNAISDTADDVVENGEDLKYELQKLQDAIEEARTEMKKS